MEGGPTARSGALGVCEPTSFIPTDTITAGCRETFPLPWPLDTLHEALTDEQRGHRDAIDAAARALDEARRRWLNPPEWVRAEPDVLRPRLMPVDEHAERELPKRTLTNLHNARPTWLSHLQAALDTAVFAAYGWPETDAPDTLGEQDLLSRLLALNVARSGSRLG